MHSNSACINSKGKQIVENIIALPSGYTEYYNSEKELYMCKGPSKTDARYKGHKHAGWVFYYRKGVETHAINAEGKIVERKFYDDGGSCMFINGVLIDRVAPDGTINTYKNGVLTRTIYPDVEAPVYHDSEYFTHDSSGPTYRSYYEGKLVREIFPTGYTWHYHDDKIITTYQESAPPCKPVKDTTDPTAMILFWFVVVLLLVVYSVK